MSEHETYSESLQKCVDSVEVKDLRIILKRIDDSFKIRDSTPYSGDVLRVVGEPNPSPDWEQKLDAKVEANKKLDRTADLSTIKLYKRQKRGRIEILIPEATRRCYKRIPIKPTSLKVTEKVERLYKPK